MANILFLFEKGMATVSELELCFKRMFADCSVGTVFKKVYELSEGDLSWADFLLLIRPNNTMSLHIARRASQAGKKIAFFMDDDLFCLPCSLPSIPWRQRALMQTLKMSDMVISSSPIIINKYRDRTKEKRGIQLDTAVADYMTEFSIQESKKEDKVVKLVFAAGEITKLRLRSMFCLFYSG